MAPEKTWDRRAIEWDSRGLAFQTEGRYAEALEMHEHAVALEPLNARFQHNRANALANLGRSAEALGGFTAAIYLDPSIPQCHNGAGVIFHRLGDYERAIAAFRQAVELDRSYAEGASNLGTTLRTAGALEESKKWLLHAVKLDPANGRYYRYLVDGLSADAALEFLDVVESAIPAMGQMPDAVRAEFHFALAKLYEDAQRYDEAFEHLQQGNRLRRSALNYAETEELQFMLTMEQTFTKEFCETFAGIGNQTKRPIFVVGMPRTGTTLVEQILCAVPGVHGAGEIRAFEDAVAALQRDAQGGGDVRSGLRVAGDYYAEATQRFPGHHFVDKMPFNFRFAGLINLALPNARIIAISRDALDACFSIYATYFFDVVPFSWDLDELARYYRAYERLMAHWRTIVPADRMLEIRYEDLVEDFEANAKRIVAFCGLQWDPRVMEFHTVKRPVQTASHSQVRRPIYRSAMGRARRFERHLGPLAKALEG